LLSSDHVLNRTDMTGGAREQAPLCHTSRPFHSIHFLQTIANSSLIGMSES
jgi:hypothetical protein